MKSLKSAPNRLGTTAQAVVRPPYRGRRTASGHPAMAALRVGRVIAGWAFLCIAPVAAILIIVWSVWS